MEAVQVQLPPELMQRLRQEVTSEEMLSQVVAEAVHMWLEQRRTEKAQQDQSLAMLRDAGLAMDRARQRGLAEALIPPLRAEDMPSREQVEAILSRLKVPLSAEVIAMRGER